MSFKCHKCGTLSERKKACCDTPMEQTCPICKFGKDFCTCEVPSTKAHKPR